MTLFSKDEIPRSRKPIKRMHVEDAGCCEWEVRFKCSHCGHDEGWKQYPEMTITDFKKGLPCPKCNIII